MFHGARCICKLLVTFINVLLISNVTLLVDASQRIINSMNVTSSNIEKVKILNFGYDQSGKINVTFQAMQPWDRIKVRLHNLRKFQM